MGQDTLISWCKPSCGDRIAVTQSPNIWFACTGPVLVTRGVPLSKSGKDIRTLLLPYCIHSSFPHKSTWRVMIKIHVGTDRYDIRYSLVFIDLIDVNIF